MKIKFLPQNIEVEGTPEKSLLQIATENHLEIRSICKGVPSCAECRVHIAEGDSNILPPNKAELGLIGTNYFIDGRRLSCQVHCFGDVTVDLTEQVERQENQTKKIRGFRSNKQVESRAVNDMMLLNEKDEKSKDSGAEHSGDPSSEQSTQQNEVREGKSNKPHPQQQRQQNRPQQQNQNRQQQGNQGRGPKDRQQGSPRDQQKQKK